MQMPNLGTPLFIGLALIAVAIIGALARKGGGRKATGALQGKRPLTEREQGMYFRLREVFPEHVVLAQVAFSALMTTKDRPTRATFDRKVADFVLCDKAFNVVAAIELDDSSHKGREAQDGNRDALLDKAGIRVIRFARTPDRGDLLKAVEAVGT